MATLSALVHQVRGAQIADAEKRAATRHLSAAEATSRPLDTGGAICWGGTIHDVSTGGLGLTLCYPFRPGTHLAIDLQTAHGQARTLLARVAHVRDQADGTWLLGCEFVKPLPAGDVASLL
jgi:hypothetical protein